MKNTFKRVIASILIFCTATLGMHGTSFASIVGTDEVQTSQNASANIDKLNHFLARDDVQRGLLSQGVDPDAARARVAALTDVEAAELAGRVDKAPAGGSALGVIFTIFLVLLITDILGWTKVFPFTRSIK